MPKSILNNENEPFMGMNMTLAPHPCPYLVLQLNVRPRPNVQRLTWKWACMFGCKIYVPFLIRCVFFPVISKCLFHFFLLRVLKLPCWFWMYCENTHVGFDICSCVSLEKMRQHPWLAPSGAFLLHILHPPASSHLFAKKANFALSLAT